MKIYQNPTTTADMIFERRRKKRLEILLILRGSPPFKGKWAIPGGCLEYGKETVEQCGARESEEEVGARVKVRDMELFGVYSDPGRDPRGHVISHAYRVKKYTGRIRAGDDADKYRWFVYEEIPDLAFDHKKILEDYVKKYHPKMRRRK